MKIGNKEFDENRTHIMGILNVTPDSFSDGGKWNSIDAALKHTEQMIADGAAIIDIGGESTRPGYTMISDEEEISRVVPVIEAVKRSFDIPVSVDTYKSGVARAALGSGADLLNDIWGFKHDKDIAAVTKEYDVPVCLMHNRDNTDYTDYLNDVLSDLRESVEIAKNAGIADDKIILDPGVGFAKTLEQNLQITNRLELLHTLGYPILLGTSRKSMIGLTLDLPRDERVEGTVATSVIGCMKGAMFVRVHDVKENFRAVRMTEAIINS
ncbi:MAG: dihydropteroate synthase [Candidatus Ornithomonoglobus sp.]